MGVSKEIRDKFNQEPVHYCGKCLSLKVLNLDEETGYCDECGSTDIKETDITSWEMMYIGRYGKRFRENK